MKVRERAGIFLQSSCQLAHGTALGHDIPCSLSMLPIEAISVLDVAIHVRSWLLHGKTKELPIFALEPTAEASPEHSSSQADLPPEAFRQLRWPACSRAPKAATKSEQRTVVVRNVAQPCSMTRGQAQRRST